ncbi:hypothetical protein [Flavobacterium marginilacus]|uniref:hypothetical protein n=1 Tax=Flavobacterium marginilacus TaxID=3003256 RepID=UPI00248EE5D2|nr:hypothetical protein [Flavobacterium marginilacus]
MSKKIAIIFWDGWLGVAPTLLSLIEYFSEKENHIFVYLRDDNEYDLSIIETFDKNNVTFERIKSRRSSLRIKFIHKLTFVLNKLINTNLFSLKALSFIKNSFQNLEPYIYINNFSRQIKKNKEDFFDVTFCVDSIGLFAYEKSKINSKKIVNLSLEISYDLKKKSNWLNMILKKNERNYLKGKISFTLIQDHFRWQIYKRINNILDDNFVLLPNSIRMNLENEKIKKSNFFYKKFNLDTETLIVLSAGMICDEVCSFEIAQAVGNYSFKNKTKIIFHNRLKNGEEDPYLDKVRTAGKENICLSLDPVLFSELHTVFNSAQIGLVIYNTNNTDENYNAIGAASGKLYQYLKYGLPLIASNTGGLRELVLENNLGVIVDTPSDIPSAIEKITSNYNWYSDNAKIAFEQKLNIDIFLKKIDKLI